MSSAAARITGKHQVLCFLAAACLFAALFGILSSSRPLRPEDTPGGNDFIAYWAAYQQARAGNNPYNGQELLETQRALYPSLQQPQLYWNPPWTLALLSPVLALPFDYSRSLWFLLNLLMLFASCVLISRLDRPESDPGRPAWLILTAGAFFVPAWHALKTGQLSLLVLFGLCGFLFFERRNRCLPAAAALVLAAVKPHAVYLILLFFAIYLLQRRKLRIFGFACLLQTLLCAAAYLLLPRAYDNWAHAQALPVHWMTSTLATYVRLLVHAATGSIPVWPVAAIPLAGALSLLLWSSRHAAELTLNRVIFILTASLLTAPYAWVFDYSVLVIAQTAIAAAAAARPRKIKAELLFWLTALQAGALAASHVFSSMHYEIWFPAAMLLIWLRARKVLPGLISAGSPQHRS